MNTPFTHYGASSKCPCNRGRTPDIAFPGLKIAVFCDSSFWHGRDLEKRKPGLKVNPGYWIAKIERNMEWDHRVNGELAALGWEVIRFWDVDINSDLRGCVATVQQSVEARKRGSD